MSQLQDIIEKLKVKEEVDAVLLTGSHGEGVKPYSDIDLIIVLKNNFQKIESVFTWIDDTFADIYFFDLGNIEKMITDGSVFAGPVQNKDHSTNYLLPCWLEKGTIQFDKSGKLTLLKSLNIKTSVDRSSRESACRQINYNFEANTRYFKSNDPLYHEALEIRLMYSIVELIVGYFLFRDIPWQGEKKAVGLLKEDHQDFYNEFISYSKSQNLKDKFAHYANMVRLVLVSEYSLWSRNEILAKHKEHHAGADESVLAEYWKKLIA